MGFFGKRINGVKIELIIIGRIDSALKPLYEWNQPIKFEVPDLSVTSLTISMGNDSFLYLDCKNSNGDVTPISSAYLMGGHLIGTSVKMIDRETIEKDQERFREKMVGKSGEYRVGEVVLVDTEALREKDRIMTRLWTKYQDKLRQARVDHDEIFKDFEDKMEVERKMNKMINQRLRKRIEDYEEQLLVLPHLIKEEISRIYTKALFTRFESDPTTTPELKQKLKEFRVNAKEYFNEKKKEMEDKISQQQRDDEDFEEKIKMVNKKEAELKQREEELKRRQQEIQEEMKKINSEKNEIEV